MNETKRFEDALDECLERMLVKGETPEQCIERFPEHSDKLKPLLETVMTARRVMPVQPRPEFRERARYQLNAALQEKSEKKKSPFFAWGLQLGPVGVAVAVLLVISAAGGGTVAAARSSMPDSALYPVKLASEEVQMALTFSDLGKAELNARLADERVTEITYLAVNNPDKIPEVSEKMKEHLGEITSLLARAPVIMSAAPLTTPTLTAPAPAVPTTPTAPVPAPAPAIATPAEEIAPMQAAAPAEAPAQPQAERATGAGEENEPKVKIDSSANESKKQTTKSDSKGDKRAKLKSTVEGQASTNSARLRSLLETAPESTRQYLQRAIDDSETEYRKAIEAIDD